MEIRPRSTRWGRAMRAGAALALLVAVALLVPVDPSIAAAATPKASEPAAPSTASARVIVRLVGTPALSVATGLAAPQAATRSQAASRVRRQIQTLHGAQQDFRNRLVAAGIPATVRAEFSQVLNALALTVPSSQLGRLASIPGVAAVYPDTTVHATVDEDVSLIGAPQVWQTNDPSGRADQGEGETVAIVDTGIDYNHPDLGGGFGPGYKVVAGYNFVQNTPNPMDDNGHGTHVAGVIAGDPAEPGGRTGVAPKATLTAYKVLDSSGSGSESTVIAGLEAAVSVDNPHRADVVNLSLGTQPAPADPLEQACEGAVHAGVVVVAAAGNNGPGEATVGSPAEAPDVLAVGASISGVSVPTIAVTAPVREPISAARLNLSANPPAGGEDLGVVDVGNGQPSNYFGVDVTGKAVLVNYNSFLLSQQLATAVQNGAAAILFHTPNYYSTGTQPGPVLPDFAAGTVDDPNKLSLVAVVVNGTDATDIQQWLAQGPVQIHVGASDATDEIAAFSAHGPAPGSYALKPDLVAPGVEIGSTWLGGAYRDDSGTSMAAPHAAGAAALLREAHPAWTASQVDAAMTGGAHMLSGYNAVTQGAGRLDVAAADQAAVLPAPRVANLGLANLVGSTLWATTSVTLTNVSAEARQLQIASDPAPGAAARIDVSPRAAGLAPGQSLSVAVTLTGPRPAAATDISGWLVVSTSGAPTVTIPYLLAVRPLELHADPDPTSSASTVFIHAEPDLAAAPTVLTTGPQGQTTSSTAAFDHTGWWKVAVPAGTAGTYQVAASATAAAGATLSGATTFEELAPPSGGSGWQPVGPDSQGAYLMAFSSQPGRSYAVTTTSPHAGLFRTDNSGATWQELRQLPVGDGIDMGVAADPIRPDTVYLAVQGGGNDPTYQGRILASDDAGTTWTTLPFPNVTPHALSIDATGQILTAPAFNGNVYVSVDRGQTWTAYPSPNGFPQQARVIGHDLYIAAGNGLFVIRNVDSSPSPAQRVFSSPVSYQSVMDVVGDGHMLVADTVNEVVASRDGGASWQTLFSPPSDDPFLSSIQLVNGDIYVCGSSHIWVDPGEGATFTSMPTPVARDFFVVGGWPSAGSPLVVSAESTGLFTTTDQGASYLHVGLTGASVNALVVDENSAGQESLLAGTTFSNFSTPVPEQQTVTAATRDWGITAQQSIIGGRVVSLAVDPADPHTVYRVVANAFSRINIDRSTDGGTTWIGVENVRVSSRAYQIVDDPANADYLYVTVNDPLSPGVLVSRDAGRTWRKNNLPVLVTAIAADPHNPDRLWLGGPGGLYLSTDAGQTVTQQSTIPVTSISLDPRDPSHLVVGGNGLYYSQDGGRHLAAATTSGYHLNVTALLFAPGGRIYAGDGYSHDSAGLPVGGRGVLVSDDGGHSWTNISSGLANLYVDSLALSPDGHWLYAGTEGGSVYRMATG